MKTRRIRRSRINENQKITLTLGQLKKLIREGIDHSEDNRIEAEETLSKILPHGSGIDYDWTFKAGRNGDVIVSNAWHYMNSNGYYVGALPFEITIHSDGSFDNNTEIFDLNKIADSEIGQEIANSYASDDYEDEQDDDGAPDLDYVRDVVREELHCLEDIIWDRLEDVNKRILRLAIQRFNNWA